jgi:hypothetical protein
MELAVDSGITLMTYLANLVSIQPRNAQKLQSRRMGIVTEPKSALQKWDKNPDLTSPRLLWGVML